MQVPWSIKNIMAVSPRPPIVAVMGHIDHGKSSLLDYIRKSKVTEGEAGGITQHVSAYEAVHEHEGTARTITFLDTPGHEAFRALRSRGAAAADVAILVVAADDGVKPQTLEAYEAIMEAGTPFVVAFTKIDKNGADLEKAKYAVLEHGIYLEGLGGSISYAGVSSKTGEGIPELLDLVLLTADMAELSTNPESEASGFVLESSQDPKQGITATLILKDGTLNIGDFAIAGSAMVPVRFIENFAGKRITTATASQPIRLAGWSSLPPAGTPFICAKTKKDAEKLVATPERASLRLDQLTTEEKGKVLLPLIIKADATGSIAAIKHELAKIAHERVAVRIVSEGLGAVSENDVKTAQAGGATIIAFTVGTDGRARDLADRAGVSIETFSIIYDLAERVSLLVTERSPRFMQEEILGQAKILKVFSVTGVKHVLGARWESGALTVGDLVKVDRRGIPLGTMKLTNLQQVRNDVKEIHVEGEFGLQLEGKVEIAAGDTIQTYTTVEK
jgi:translation initiation factor IF-2